MKTPKTVAEYLAAAPPDKRAALQKLRRVIKAAAPGATEGIAYGLIGFKHQGKPLAGLAYWKDHCALYGATAAQIARLKGYDTSKGTIRFSAAKPVPDALVRRIVRSRLAEIEASGAGYGASGR